MDRGESHLRPDPRNNAAGLLVLWELGTLLVWVGLLRTRDSI